MDVDTRLLRYFCAVAEEGNLTRAAERTFVSQPALTKQEFGIMLADVEDPAAAEAVAQRIGDALHRPLDIRGHRIQTAASIGIALSDRNCADADELLRHADQAMYHAKRMKDGVRTTYHVDARLPA
jgi:predicted signal transduction protein with EAL and GGDEF domain